MRIKYGVWFSKWERERAFICTHTFTDNAIKIKWHAAVMGRNEFLTNAHFMVTILTGFKSIDFKMSLFIISAFLDSTTQFVNINYGSECVLNLKWMRAFMRIFILFLYASFSFGDHISIELSNGIHYSARFDEWKNCFMWLISNFEFA